MSPVALHQIGHDSENLLLDDRLPGFGGAVLSPVNYAMDRTAAQVRGLRAVGRNAILDPQFYVPASDRGHLREWPYFPADVDTADLSSIGWWDARLEPIATCARTLGVNALCSPASLPRAYTVEYYDLFSAVGKRLQERVADEFRVLQTLVVSLPELTIAGRAEEIATIVTRHGLDDVYLVLLSDVEPRRELSDPDQLAGAVRLSRLLSESGAAVTVAFTAADCVLWLHAGAQAVATGKFFNLRRFTRARWEEPTEGGRNIPYWFEESLMAFIRESDLVRVRRVGLLSEASARNPLAQAILAQLEAEPGRAWVALGWRQYLWWCADVVARFGAEQVRADDLFAQAERNWIQLENQGVLTEETRNEGSWLRAWRRALREA